MITIREMDISDYQAVIELWGQTDNLSLRDADSEQNIAAYLERNPRLSFVHSRIGGARYFENPFICFE